MEGIRKDDRAENNNNYGLSPVPAPFLESFRQCHCCRQGTCIVERKSQAGLLTYPSSQRLLTPWGNGFVLRRLAGHTAAGLFGIRTRFPVRRGRYARTCSFMLVCLRSKGRKHFFQSASIFSKDAAKLLLFFDICKDFSLFCTILSHFAMISPQIAHKTILPNQTLSATIPRR